MVIPRKIPTGIVVLCLCVPAAARAAPESATTDDAKTQQAKTELAKSYYQLGAKLYAATRYADALEQFKKAYRLTRLPELLYNIGRCHEMLAKAAAAIALYERYLRDAPDAKHRKTVEARIKELRRQLHDSGMPAEPAAAPSTSGGTDAQAESARVTQTAPQTDSGWGWKKTSGWVAVGVGGASIVAGIIFGALASSKSSDYDAAVDDERPYAELEQIKSDGESLQTAQIATLVIGGVIAAAGGGLLLWDHFGNKDQTTDNSAMVLPCLTDGGLGVAASLRF